MPFHGKNEDFLLAKEWHYPFLPDFKDEETGIPRSDKPVQKDTIWVKMFHDKMNDEKSKSWGVQCSYIVDPQQLYLLER